ncbi:MAG: PilW family protein, partial [Gammaproteobacteria bacterium]|nr:PilW family protein [Gammaproteobacteria bacterium]
PAAQTFALVAHGYHVSPDSTRFGAGVPSLRRQTLVDGPAIEDQEVLSGVEDFQFQFGIDTDGDLDANRYVNANNPMLVPGDPAFDPNAQIVSVRIWLRMRTIHPEQGHTDTSAYVYADHNTPAPNDNFRRLVVSKTIQLRNTKERV